MGNSLVCSGGIGRVCTGFVVDGARRKYVQSSEDQLMFSGPVQFTQEVHHLCAGSYIHGHVSGGMFRGGPWLTGDQ